MFWSKARRIKLLQETVDLGEKNYSWKLEQQGRYAQEIKELKEQIVGLTADRDGGKIAIEQLQEAARKLQDSIQPEFERVRQEIRAEISALRAERDQFAKRVEELEREKAEYQKGHGGEVIQLRESS